MQRIAQDWLVLSLTGSVTAVGVNTALQFAPVVVFGLFGGVLADRYPKRMLLVVTQSVAGVLAAALAVLTLSGGVRVEHVFAVSFALGVVSAVEHPARQVFVPELVGRTHLRSALSLNSSVFQLGGVAKSPPPRGSVLITNAAHDGLTADLRAAGADLDGAQAAHRAIPARLPLAQVNPGQQVLDVQTKLITHAIRIAAFNTATALARAIRVHTGYARANHEAHAPGLQTWRHNS